MFNFDFLEKGLGIVSPSHFEYDFSGKICSINWPNFIAWLPLLLQILGKVCIASVRFPACNVVSFEINFVFQDKKLNILRTKRAFKVKKAFSTIFKELSFAKNCLRPESAPLNISRLIYKVIQLAQTSNILKESLMAETNLKFCVFIDSIPSHQHKLYTYILFATLLIFFNN